MNIQLSELKQIIGSLSKLLNNDQLNGKTSYMLSKAVDTINKELSFVDTTHQKLVTKYGVADTKGNVTVTPENMEAFLNEINPVMATEIELNIRPIKFSDLPEKAGLSAVDFRNLKELILEDTPINPE